MTGSPQLTPDHIRQFINESEAALRGKHFSHEILQAVFRYGAFVGSDIEQHERVSRGADSLRQRIRQAEEENRSFPSGMVILADEMEHSKGRFQRYWHAPRGGLWMTLGLANTLLPQNSLFLPMAAGVSCCEVLRDYGIEAHIKWVNDTLVENRKISGILTETFTGQSFGEEYILIGIGINVNNCHFPTELSQTATSMKSCLHREINLQEAVVKLLAKLQWNIGLIYFEEARHLEENGGIAVQAETSDENQPKADHLLLRSYKKLTDIVNRRVLFGFDVQKNPQFEAKVVGLDNSGGLILETDDGSRVVQHSGEIIYLD